MMWRLTRIPETNGVGANDFRNRSSWNRRRIPWSDSACAVCQTVCDALAAFSSGWPEGTSACVRDGGNSVRASVCDSITISTSLEASAKASSASEGVASLGGVAPGGAGAGSPGASVGSSRGVSGEGFVDCGDCHIENVGVNCGQKRR